MKETIEINILKNYYVRVKILKYYEIGVYTYIEFF